MLTKDEVKDFRRDGFLVLRGVISPAELQRLDEVSRAILASGAALGRELDTVDPLPPGVTELEVDLPLFFDKGFLYAADGHGHRVFRRAERLWQRDAIFRITTAHPVILNAVWQLLESPFVPSNDSLVVKLPGAGAAVPWHRDVEPDALHHAGGDPCRDFTIDIYLDASTEANGCLVALPGSHLDGQPAPRDFDAVDTVCLTAEPGDVFVHATGLLHGSPPNTSSDLRRTFYIHFRGPAALAAAPTQESIRRVRKTEPAEWIAGQVELLRTAMAERAASGFDHEEQYVGPVARPEATTPGLAASS